MSFSESTISHTGRLTLVLKSTISGMGGISQHV